VSDISSVVDVVFAYRLHFPFGFMEGAARDQVKVIDAQPTNPYADVCRMVASGRASDHNNEVQLV